MALNSELVAAVWSARFAEKLLETGRQLIAAGPPTAYEYRIARDEDGRIIVAFGPNDHLGGTTGQPSGATSGWFADWRP